LPLLFAPLVAILLGIGLAWASRDTLVQRETALVTTRGFAVTVALSVLVFAPVCGYFAAFHGDWSYLYLVGSARIPSAVDLALVLLASTCLPLGFLLGAPAARSRRPERLLRTLAGPAVAMLALGVLLGKRLGTSASYAQFHGDFGQSAIDKSPLGQGVLVAWITLSLGVAWAFRVARRSR
jgi:hypothetical protein